MRISRENNFDLIRLIAALQVVLWHAREHLKLPSLLDGFIGFTGYFPGVPVFFTISGFLIVATFDRNHDLRRYFLNRVLRIYPGLWVCLAFTVFLLAVFGYINSAAVSSATFFFWLAGQLTVFQLYTPEMFRGFGVGTPNGSLWTIPIEISFYLFVPVYFWICRTFKIKRHVLILFFAGISVSYNLFYQEYIDTAQLSGAGKLLRYNLLPYLFFFLTGSLIYTYWDRIKKIYENKGLYWLSGYAAYAGIFSVWLGKYNPTYWPDFYGFLSILILSQTVLSLAYTKRSLSARLLKGKDLSYSIYLYHMPVINSLLYLGNESRYIALPVVLVSVLILAWLSWHFVEKPALALKRR